MPIVSEGGTEEDRRIDPPLNFVIFIENNSNIWKKIASDPPLDKENFSNPPLDEIRSALTVSTQFEFTKFSAEFAVHPLWNIRNRT